MNTSRVSTEEGQARPIDVNTAVLSPECTCSPAKLLRVHRVTISSDERVPGASAHLGQRFSFIFSTSQNCSQTRSLQSQISALNQMGDSSQCICYRVVSEFSSLSFFFITDQNSEIKSPVQIYAVIFLKQIHVLPCQRSFKDEVDLKNPRKQLNTSLSPTRKKKRLGDTC